MNPESPITATEKPTEILPKPLTIVLTSDDDDERPVYISGNFNQWETQDKRYAMEKISEGLYHFTFSAGCEYPEELLYKFTRGDWSEVEIDRFGNRTENRSCKQHQGTVKEHVEKWRRNWLPFKPNFLPKVQLVSDAFEIPQLNTTRRVWALLPYDYETSSESYPVLYLQDAQNLFNEKAQFGNWEIDKKLAVMAEYKIGKIIVIAVEHAEKDRLNEYNVGHTILGSGNGKKYIRFLTDTLKPFVDANFRTKTAREHTGIGGSSMGGLVSIFSGIMYPEVFGKLMVFSPSLWIVPKIKLSILDMEETEDTRVYLYAGGAESETMVAHVQKFKKRLHKKDAESQKIKIRLSINAEGKHNETYWSDEFPKAIEWLFFSTKDE